MNRKLEARALDKIRSIMAGGVYGFHNWRALSGLARLIGGALRRCRTHARTRTWRSSGRARRRSFAAMASSLLATVQLGRHRRGIESTWSTSPPNQPARATGENGTGSARDGKRQGWTNHAKEWGGETTTTKQRWWRRRSVGRSTAPRCGAVQEAGMTRGRRRRGAPTPRLRPSNLPVLPLPRVH